MLMRPLVQSTLRASARPAIMRPVAMQAMSASRLMFAPYRKITTQSATPEEGMEILKRQRTKRPMSPHLTIYKFEQNMITSSFHRITGVALGGAFYLFLLSYLGLPALGYEITSDGLMAAFGALPLAVKLPVKFVASLPFTFHFFNGIRHLIWDTGRLLSIKNLVRSGNVVIGLTFLSSALLAFI